LIDRKVEFVQYGSGGDYAGARRGRRAFRYAVAVILVFSGGLWLAEQYLRHEETERHYLLALTHEPEAARVHLRQAIKIDAATGRRPTVKYVAALAEREEEEKRLRTYEAAHTLDPANSFLAMRYGCELFARHEMRRARELFGAAYQSAPQNALPIYLEAATLPFLDEENPRLEEAFGLLQRANLSADPLVFQRPLWFSTLPQRGEWYARWRREIVYDMLVPIQLFADRVFLLAEAEIAAGERWDFWDALLEAVEVMGYRIVRHSSPDIGAPNALVGLPIQLAALEVRERLRELQGRNAADLVERRAQLQRALAVVVAFESSREERIAAEKTKLQLPLYLISRTGMVLLGVYLLSYVLSRVSGAGRQSWTLAHSVSAKLTVLVSSGLFLVLLLILTWLERQIGDARLLLSVVTYAWVAILGFALVFGAFYPGFMLPLAHQVVHERVGAGSDMARLLSLARRQRRIAYISLLRRYYGILLGCFLITSCLWVIAFRVFYLLYPWQIKLLAPGLTEDELETVGRAISILS
jgi:hypothetical protein